MLFRKTTAEELLKLFAQLSDEEKAKFLDQAKPTTGEQVEKAEEDIAEKGPDSQTEKDRIDESVAAQEKADGDEDSQDAEDRVDESVGEEAAEAEAEAETAPEATAEPEQAPEEPGVVTDNRDEVLESLADRVNSLEEALKGLEDLRAQMEEYTAKQAETFGYKGRVHGGEKDIQDMSADELKDHILHH